MKEKDAATKGHMLMASREYARMIAHQHGLATAYRRQRIYGRDARQQTPVQTGGAPLSRLCVEHRQLPHQLLAILALGFRRTSA